MNPAAWLILLVCANGVLLLLPMLPALREWRGGDTRPLHIPDDDEAGIEYFATRFRQRLLEDWNGHPFFLAPRSSGAVGAEAPGAALDPALPVHAGQSDQFRIAPSGRPVVGRKRPGPSLEPVLIGCDVELAEGSDYLGDIYARNSLHSNGGSLVRAVLSDGNVTLGAGSGILRWAHARRLLIGAGSRVPGRLSALESISLGTDCRFQRVKAPIIDIGPPRDWTIAPAHAAPPAGIQPADPDSAQLHWQKHSARWTREGDTMLPPGCVVDGDLIVRGKVRLGADCVIRGSIKAYGDVEVGRGSIIEGSCFSHGHILLQRDCRVSGQVSSIISISFADACMIGRPGRPASTIAPQISISGSCRLHGSLWARNSGRTLRA